MGKLQFPLRNRTSIRGINHFLKASGITRRMVIIHARSKSRSAKLDARLSVPAWRLSFRLFCTQSVQVAPTRSWFEEYDGRASRRSGRDHLPCIDLGIRANFPA